MRDPKVFYGKEDLWRFPQEFYRGSAQQMEPYYVIMRLPGEESEEFLLMLPFTPENRDNTIAWLAARSDGEHYGRLLVYQLPKDKLIYGPKQVENRIVQDTKITEQFALWSRGGSNVLRGNLLMIPIENSFLYVEPVFLEGAIGGLPELKGVIVVIGDDIAMDVTLDGALAAIFESGPPGPGPTPQPPPVPSGEIEELVESIQDHLDKMREYAGAGNWAAYGGELEALEADIERLAEITAGEG